MSGAPDSSGAIALTGATGFIGRAVLNSLLAEGHAVQCLTRRENALPRRPGVTEIHGDLEDEAALARLVDGAHAVIHAAGGLGAEDAETLTRINVTASRRLARLSAGAGAARFVFLSSLTAREPHLSRYARSKREAEKAVHGAAGAMAAVSLRLPAIYGPGDANTAPLIALMRKGWLPHPAVESRFSLLHVEDAAAAVLAALSASDALEGAYEIPAGDPVNWPGLAEAAERVRGRPVRTVAAPGALLKLAAAANRLANRVTGAPHAFTPGKAREMLHPDWTVRSAAFTARTGWTPAITLQEGLARMLDNGARPSHSPALGDAYDAR